MVFNIEFGCLRETAHIENLICREQTSLPVLLLKSLNKHIFQAELNSPENATGKGNERDIQ